MSDTESPIVRESDVNADALAYVYGEIPADVFFEQVRERAVEIATRSVDKRIARKSGSVA